MQDYPGRLQQFGGARMSPHTHVGCAGDGGRSGPRQIFPELQPYLVEVFEQVEGGDTERESPGFTGDCGASCLLHHSDVAATGLEHVAEYRKKQQTKAQHGAQSGALATARFG